MFLHGIRARHAALGGGCEELMKELPPLSLVHWIHLNTERLKCSAPWRLFFYPAFFSNPDSFLHNVHRQPETSTLVQFILASCEGRSQSSRLNQNGDKSVPLDFLPLCFTMHSSVMRWWCWYLVSNKEKKEEEEIVYCLKLGLPNPVSALQICSQV